ncbi:MAG: metalloregulator ArsR/SmtB family transcription factor [Vallitaleaceae bacterium]|jgi:DNA-binding transcriptional ArsR family regulator|nr:metalloregulator ArsR/SmtB family transcription factor [Vallitaleaceae bacterium]
MEKYHCKAAYILEASVPSEEKAMAMADFFKVFGDTTRIKILSLLLESELCVHDIATLLNMEQSAISHQLRVLRQNKLVKVRKEGKSSHYTILDNHVYKIITQGLDHLSE